jgi:hypothetical protein
MTPNPSAKAASRPLRRRSSQTVGRTMPAVRYPKAWYALFAFLSAGLIVALAPFWQSQPTPPTLGPLQRSLHAELAAALISAGADPKSVSCRGAKGSTLLGCSARIANVNLLAADLASRGWNAEPEGGHPMRSFKRAQMKLFLEYSSPDAYLNVVERK